MGFNKPQGYDEATVGGEFTPLDLGGHLCVIKQVEITQTKTTKKDMLVIHLDTDKADKQPGYYAEQFRNDIRPEKKWGCTHYIVNDESNEYSVKNIKTFVTSVEKSNSGFSVQWGDNFAQQFKDKKIGVVFGQEEYLNKDNDVKKITKPRFFRSVESVLDAQVPEIKKLKDTPQNTNISSDGFVNIPDGLDQEELPFN